LCVAGEPTSGYPTIFTKQENFFQLVKPIDSKAAERL